MMHNIKLKLSEIDTQGNIQEASASYRLESRAYCRATTVWDSFGYAWQGLVYVFRTQRNAKIHTTLSACVVVMALLLKIALFQWAILITMMGLVLFAEMLNTVVESLVDLVSPDFHPLAKIAKDAAAGAVFLVATLSVIVGLFIFGPELWKWATLLFF